MSSINLSKRIKEIRGKLKISQDKLSKKANIPFSTLAKIEAGYTPNPSMETLIKIADAFEIGLDELIGRKWLTKIDFMINFNLGIKTKYKVVCFEGGTATLIN
mgnify:CR=1 FL=1